MTNDYEIVRRVLSDRITPWTSAEYRLAREALDRIQAERDRAMRVVEAAQRACNTLDVPTLVQLAPDLIDALAAYALEDVEP